MLKFLRKNKNIDQATVLRQKVTGRVISDSYKNLSKEIESLRQYDRGEKKITASDIRATVRGL